MVPLTNRSTDAPSAPGVERRRSDDRSDHAHRQLIGYIGLALPALLIGMASVRPDDAFAPWRAQGSISAYYYSGATAAFIGLLVALALFLITYRGYANRHQGADRAAAVTAALAALGVAVFPTGAPEGAVAPSWWTPATGVVHYSSAIMLFAMFAVFSLWLFRLKAEGEAPSPAKRTRNRIYLACGVVIVASMVWAAINGRAARPIFLPESLALVAFAISWLVKGKAHRTLAHAAGTVAAGVAQVGKGIRKTAG